MLNTCTRIDTGVFHFRSLSFLIWLVFLCASTVLPVYCHHQHQRQHRMKLREKKNTYTSSISSNINNKIRKEEEKFQWLIVRTDNVCVHFCAALIPSRSTVLLLLLLFLLVVVVYWLNAVTTIHGWFGWFTANWIFGLHVKAHRLPIPCERKRNNDWSMEKKKKGNK